MSTKLRMTYSAMNTDDVTDFLNWVIEKRLIGQRSDGSQYIYPLHNKLVGDIRHEMEYYTLRQFSRAEVLTDEGVTHQNEWDPTNLGRDVVFMMELKDNG